MANGASNSTVQPTIGARPSFLIEMSTEAPSPQFWRTVSQTTPFPRIGDRLIPPPIRGAAAVTATAGVVEVVLTTPGAGVSASGPTTAGKLLDVKTAGARRLSRSPTERRILRR